VTQEYISSNHEVLGRIITEVNSIMAESKTTANEEFWLFHDLEEDERIDLRKFIDPELDLDAIMGIDTLFDKLNHLLD